MDHDQLFKAVLTVQLAPFMELFFPDEAAQLDLAHARFVDKELFAAPPSGPGRELDLLADIPLLTPPTAGAGDREPAHTLVAIHIEVQAQREPDFIWRDLEYYALQRRIRGVPVLPIALFPLVDVLGREHGRRPRVGFERVVQRDVVLGHQILAFEFLAVTLRALDAATYLARPQALAGALAARMRPAPHMPLSNHKVACLRRIMGGAEMTREDIQQLLVNVVETYLPLTGKDAEEFEALLRLSENEGIRDTMKTWAEQKEEIGKKMKAREDVLRVLEARFGPVPAAVAERVRSMDDEAALDALLVRAATAATLADTGLLVGLK